MVRVRSHLIFCIAKTTIFISPFISPRPSQRYPSKRLQGKKACQTAACVLGPPFGVRHRRAQPFFLCVGASGGWPGQEEAVFID